LSAAARALLTGLSRSSASSAKIGPPLIRLDRGNMSGSGAIVRVIVAALIIVAIPVAGIAQQTLKIFDAHLHYNQICANFPSPCADTGYCQWRQKPLENKRFLLTAPDTV
jgi:hypothetical protein